jgi:FkbM family methyltransferase
VSLKSLLRSVTPAPLWRAAAAMKNAGTVGYENTCFAAYGEDLVMLSWLRRYRCDLKRFRYVDVGAAHPMQISNTYLLYASGASGVLVEPDPVQVELLRRARPRDVVVHAGVSFDDRRSATLFRMTFPHFNSFSREHAEELVKDSEKWPVEQRQRIVGEVEVPLIPLNEIIRSHFRQEDGPNLVSIDAEGIEFEVLRSLDFSLMSRDLEIPSFLCTDGGVPIAELLSFMEPTGFQLIARTADNWVFRRYKDPLF